MNAATPIVASSASSAARSAMARKYFALATTIRAGSADQTADSQVKQSPALGNGFFGIRDKQSLEQRLIL